MRVGRNDPCPCGSGRKYKHCCLRADEERARGGSEPGGGFGSGARPGAGSAAGTTRAGMESFDPEEMLMAQAGVSSREELHRLMREFEAHCESLPDGASAPTFMQYLGRANEASGVQNRLAEEVRGREFENREELENYVSAFTAAESSATLDDFEGLSPGEMHTLLYGQLADNDALVAFSDALSDEKARSVALVRVVQWVLKYHVDHDGEVKLTDRGNYPRALCRAFLGRFEPGVDTGRSVPSEQSIPLLYAAHDVLVGGDYTEESAKKSWIATQGVSAFSRGTWAAVYRTALLYLLDAHDWKLWLPEELQHAHFDIIGQAGVFLLYLLHRHPTGTVGEFYDRFTRAFPAFTQPTQGREADEDLFRDIFSILFFEHAGPLFGLVRLPEGYDTYPASPQVRYEAADVFRAAFVWRG